jgi:aspartate carbamoyltransferase regulatory subunit
MKREMGMIDDNRKYINKFISKIITEPKTTTNGLIEYTVLSKINNSIPIIIRGKLNNILYIYDNGTRITNPSSSISQKYDLKKSINIRFQYNGNTSVPDIIDVIYYK